MNTLFCGAVAVLLLSPHGGAYEQHDEVHVQRVLAFLKDMLEKE